MSFPISVIIPSFNGANRIVRLLRALERQNEKNFETLVVIDGSTDNTVAILNQNSWKLNLQIITQENKGRAGARNAGAEKASGQMLIFYDDDVEPNYNSVSLHIAALKLVPISVGQPLEALNGKTEFEKYKASISRKWLFALGSEPTVLNEKNLFLTAANMGIRTDVFINLNGFDPRLRDAEDYDLAVRAYINGWSILYTPANQVTHKAFDSFRDYILRQREYQQAQQVLISFNDHKLYEKYKIKKTTEKKATYFFVPGITASAIDMGLFRFLPKNTRYALYARIISALSVYYPNRKL